MHSIYHEGKIKSWGSEIGGIFAIQSSIGKARQV